MKNILLFCLIIISFTKSYSQESAIYRKDCKLFVDSTFQITEQAKKIFTENENVIMMSLYNQLYYPMIARELNIYGLVIARINFNETNDMKISLARGVDPDLDKLVMKSMEDIKHIIQNLLKNNSKIEYFIPVKFELTDNKVIEDVRKNNSLIIREYEYVRYRKTN